MSKKKVIAWNNLPARSPILSTVVYVTALNYWNAPEWLCGIVALLIGALWLSWVYSMFTRDQVDITELLDAGLEDDTNTTANNKKSGFRKMLDKQLADAQKQREDLNDKK